MKNSGTACLDLETAPLAVDRIAALAARRGEAEFWVDDMGGRTWRHFGEAVATAAHQCLEAGVGPNDLVVVAAGSTFEALAWLFGASAVQAVVAPLRAERAGEMEAWKKFLRVEWLATPKRIMHVGEGVNGPVAERLMGKLQAAGVPGLILATGGTAGTPKLVLHNLVALLATIPVKTRRPARVLPLMHFDHIGGLDMAWRALATGQVLVAPPEKITPAAVAATIVRHQVEVLPSTPSFLNLLLLAEIHLTHDLGSLRVVPYGAEPMPAGLLTRLQAALPEVEFVRRFGTSETGALPVRDLGNALVLREDQVGFEWKIVDEELWVRSPACALGYLGGNAGGFEDGGWFRTGDLAEQLPDGSVCVQGRREERINVGGEKVLPSEVEDWLLAHPLVADCRVGSEPNAVLGQSVVAEIVWRGSDRDAVAVKRELRRFGARLIARHKIPTVVRLVETIAATGNLKKSRVFRP